MQDSLGKTERLVIQMLFLEEIFEKQIASNSLLDIIFIAMSLLAVTRVNFESLDHDIDVNKSPIQGLSPLLVRSIHTGTHVQVYLSQKQ